MHVAQAGTGSATTDIRELRTFVHVAHAGSVSRAAAQLNIAQPALSRQLRKLEEELAATLLVRHGRGVALTQAGALLLRHAEALVRQFDQLRHEVQSSDAAFTGHVVLGVPPAAGLLVAPAVYREFRSRWPDATLQVREGVSSLLEEWLLDRRLDIAVLHNPPPLDEVDILPVLQECMVLACPPDAAPDAGRPVRFRDLGAVPLILPGLPHSNRRLVERAALQHGTRLHLLLEVDSVPLTKAMVQGGLGCTILTLAGVAQELAAGQLLARPIHRPPLMSTVCIASPRAQRPAWLVSELTGLVRDMIAGLVASGAWPGARLLGPAAAR